MDKGKSASNPKQNRYAREVSLFYEFNFFFFVANSEFNLLNDSMLKTKLDSTPYRIRIQTKI